jgi:hypothetical protein
VNIKKVIEKLPMDIFGNMIIIYNCHGKMLGWRPDKPWRECSIEQIKNV